MTFGLNLPTVSDDVKQMVRQLIATDEDMNRQILYLLGVGRFYNYNYAATDAAADGQSQSSVAMKSFLSNTLSGQLNNIISNAIGASNWTFGANLSTGQVGWSDMEVGGLLSGRLLNNRLQVNGMFGYRERPTSTTSFVGDFDINYLLTPSGNISLKAYSETNDRYFSKSSMTTQGVGILLKRDFKISNRCSEGKRREKFLAEKSLKNKVDKQTNASCVASLVHLLYWDRPKDSLNRKEICTGSHNRLLRRQYCSSLCSQSEGHEHVANMTSAFGHDFVGFSARAWPP